MENKIKNDEKNKKYIDYDTAESLLLEKFWELHPKETYPEWMSYLFPVIYFNEKSGRLFLSLGDYKHEPFGPEYYWKEVDGRKELMRNDLKTGHPMVVFNYTPKEYITLFKAELNVETLEISVLVDTDFSALIAYDFDGYWWLQNSKVS